MDQKTLWDVKPFSQKNVIIGLGDGLPTILWTNADLL